MFLSKIIGKKALTVSGKLFGYVKSVFLSSDFKKITALLFVDEEEEEHALSTSNLYALGEDVVLIKSICEKKFNGKVACPLSLSAYSEEGCFLGIVTDVVLEKFKIISLIVDGQTLQADKIVSIQDAVIFNFSEKKIKKTTSKKKTSSYNSTSAISSLPLKLLGRRVKADIYLNNILFIPKGTVITPQLIHDAEKNEKLVELTAKTISNIL